MKIEKAKVTIISLGEQDILTCSGEVPQHMSCMMPMGWGKPSYTSWTTPKPKKSIGFGFFSWFKWWF